MAINKKATGVAVAAGVLALGAGRRCRQSGPSPTDTVPGLTLEFRVAERRCRPSRG